ncbi:hypothetical protein L2E82_01196 [Cichorium intybus]|uniref:Uncharacterized protein n=1 Tax=Cichorium intybus TaxID=13427 RepID=A0ACB9GZ15_CICIN|nr:hypothetical protein L2E82_01196 [Cichorium intybus]
MSSMVETEYFIRINHLHDDIDRIPKLKLLQTMAHAFLGTVMESGSERGEIEMLEDSIIMKEQKFYDSNASDLVCGEDNGDKLDESRAWWKLESDSDVATL